MGAVGSLDLGKDRGGWMRVLRRAFCRKANMAIALAGLQQRLLISQAADSAQPSGPYDQT